jgi:hypothetical protein
MSPALISMFIFHSANPRVRHQSWLEGSNAGTSKELLVLSIGETVGLMSLLG